MNPETRPSADSVSVTTDIAIAPETAFEAFTKDVDVWWKRGPRYRPGMNRPSRMGFEPAEAGGRFLEIYEDEEGGAFEIGRILEWEEGVRLVFEYRARNFEPGQLTEVEIRFQPTQDGTRVTLIHRGWDGLPVNHPARHDLDGPAFTQMIGVWWADLVVAARTHAIALREGK